MPAFTRKQLKAASTKRPANWRFVGSLPLKYSIALQDVLVGQSLKSSRVDLATLYRFMLAARDLNFIDDGGLMAENLGSIAQAYRRVAAGKTFRLDGKSAEAFRELLPAFEELLKTLSARDYMKVCNDMERE